MATKRISKARKKKSFPSSGMLYGTLSVIVLVAILYAKREAIAYYLSYKTDKNIPIETRTVSLKTVLDNHSDKVFGIDISEYQDRINWGNIAQFEDGYPIDFVFIRATVGCDRKDKKFIKYWANAKEQKLICGAYHYYRPNENSLEQATLFIKTVRLQKGDFPPVLDIEKLPKEQSIERLKVGLHRWLDKVEAHYGVKPIIYSSENYYINFLKEDFADYPFWIANYTANYETINSDWSLWQVTENGKIPAIKNRVDINIFNGDATDLQDLLIN